MECWRRQLHISLLKLRRDVTFGRNPCLLLGGENLLYS